MARPRPLRALGPRTLHNYARVLDRAYGVGTGQAITTGNPLPAVIPDAVLSWPEGSKAQLRAALVRAYEAAGRRDAGELLAAKIPQTWAKKRDPEELPESVLHAFEAAAAQAKPRDRALALLPLRLGLRSEELMQLRRHAVERAVAGGSEGILRFVRKGGEEKVLPSAGVNDLLRVLLDVPARRLRVDGTSPPRQWLTLGQVLSSASTKTQYNLFNRLIHRLGKAANVPNPDTFSPHKLRHGFATRMMRAGAPIKVIQEALNHASVVTTERYVHVSGEDLRKWIPK